MSKKIILLLLVFLISCINKKEPKVENKKTVSNIPFISGEKYLKRWNGFKYEDVFIKGINLGVGIPGTLPGELAASYDDYYKWFKEIEEAGFNTIRIYTLHYPRFYKALNDYNSKSKNPIYILHGIWFNDVTETEPKYLFEKKDEFLKEISEVVDCIYGKKEISHRFGKAYGKYEVDASKWIMGYIIGREIEPYEIKAFEARNEKVTSFDGEYIKLENSNSSTVFFALALDYLFNYENKNYNHNRPASFSNWPTLDPLIHKDKNGKNLDNEEYFVDISQAEQKKENLLFISYHVYPFYPNFISDNEETIEDYLGENNYLSYIKRLKNHYKNTPLVAAEFGVPSSFGKAHKSISKMDHGGLSEDEQGIYNARMLNNLYESEFAGAILFSWIDEWWKQTWVTRDHYSFPNNTIHKWHNYLTPEQNFGLKRYDSEFKNNKSLLLSDNDIVESIICSNNYTFLKADIKFKEDIDTKKLKIGIDTYGDVIGENYLFGIRTNNLNEFAINFEQENFGYYVIDDYDLFGKHHRITRPKRLYSSKFSEDNIWYKYNWLNEIYLEDNKIIDYSIFEFENFKLKIGKKEKYSEILVYNEKTLNLYLPYTMLHFSNPSKMEVINSSGELQGEKVINILNESLKSEGVAFSIIYDNTLIESNRFSWVEFEFPIKTNEVFKKSYNIYKDELSKIN